VFPLLKILFTLAASKRGRRALRNFFAYLDSDEGRRMLAQVRKVATGPGAQRVARQVAAFLRVASERAREAQAGRRGQTRGWYRPTRPTRSRPTLFG